MAPELSPTSSQRLPPSIGRYEILNLLGQGGMAQVFLALQRGAFSSEKLVVIKQLRPELVSDEAFLTMFMDEARIALQLHHPNVVHTYEVGTENGDYFLAMEFLEGLTLSQIIRKAGREGLPLHLHLWILTQVLAGLGYAHELRSLDGEPMGIVHRDVSPSNVMVTSSGEVKLLDFGIAKAAGALSLTQHGVIKGKLGYVAPEQCVGKPSDARADLYAVGVMVWEAIAGRRRASAETSAAAFEARIRNLEPPIEAVVPDVPPRLAEICRRGLAHDPQDRYASAAEFRADLDDFLDSTYSRVGASKLAAQMVQLFTEEFTALRLRIERYVQANRRPLTSSERVPRLSNSEPVTQLAPEPSSSLQSKRSRWLLAMAAGGALVAAGAFLARSAPAPAPAPAPPPAASTPAAVTSPLAPAPEGAAPASSVRVSIVVFPKHAQLLLDGRRIENPFNRELPSDKSSHHLEARADGYQTSSQEVTFSQDVQMVLDLDRIGAPRSNRASVGRLPKQPAAASPTPRTETLPPAVSTAPARPAVAPTRTAEPSAQPGQDLRTAPRAPRALDEKDLYQ